VTIHESVRQARGKLSRQVFATKLGLSMTAVQNYETDRTPEPRSLLMLMKSAEKDGLKDVATILRRKLRESLGADPDKRLVI
jgi:DNA-binding transcriptional regulator YiaG